MNLSNCQLINHSESNQKKSNSNRNNPCKRWGHSALLYDNSMYVFGGHSIK